MVLRNVNVIKLSGGYFFVFWTTDSFLAQGTNLYPRLQVAKGRHFGDVIHKNHGMNVAVVVFHH